MPNSLEAAYHEETQTRLPDPLGRTGLWHVGTLALPAAAVSFASALVFLVVWGFLSFDREMRTLFILPSAVSWSLAVLSALLAWWIVFHCRSRPGRIGPRLWVLALALLNSLIALAAAGLTRNPAVHALVVAGFAAALALLPRLFLLHPDSRVVQNASLLSMSVLALILPAAWVFGQSIVEREKQRVEDWTFQLNAWTIAVREATSREWQLEEDPEGSSGAVRTIAEIDLAGDFAEPTFWHEAVVLGRDQELAGRAKELMDAAVEGLITQQRPRLSTLREPALYYDVSTTPKKWIKSSRFLPASETVGTYYRELGRLFAELDLERDPADSQGWRDLKEHCLAKRTELRAALLEQMKSWTDHWAVLRIPEAPELLGRSDLSRVELLQTPIARSGALALAPADLPRWLNLSYHRVKRATAPGCRSVGPYTENSRAHFRIDCDAYAPRAEGLGADLRAQMRVVYTANGLGEPFDTMEVYVLLPVPTGKTAEIFLTEVVSDFASAVRKYADVQSVDGSGSTSRMFTLPQDGIRVTSGSVRQLEAVFVRAVLR